MTHRIEPLDSGHRQSFDTGAVRDLAEGKGRYDLLPYEPKRRWAVWTEAGIKKYGERNWERGIPLMRFLDSASRHLDKLIAGHTDEDHASAVMWNVGGYIQTLKWIEDGVLPPTLDDRPRRHVTFVGQEAEIEATVASEEQSQDVRDGYSDVYEEEEADKGKCVCTGYPVACDYDPAEAARNDIDEIVDYIHKRLSNGTVSGVQVVGELSRAGHNYPNIKAGRDKAGVHIVTVDYLPHWKLKETK